MGSSRPIIFSGEMVRAILDGRKTQTRRVIKPQPGEDGVVEVGQVGDTRGVAYIHGSRGGQFVRVPCPYGRPGDRLWVREKFRLFNAWEECTHYDLCSCHRYDGKPIYYADCLDDEAKWRPSIHMPRWASRITLEITGVRVELVRDISEIGAVAEGIKLPGVSRWQGEAIDRFRGLWDSINANRGFGWDTNPWVWVIEFLVIQSAKQVTGRICAGGDQSTR